MLLGFLIFQALVSFSALSPVLVLKADGRLPMTFDGFYQKGKLQTLHIHQRVETALIRRAEKRVMGLANVISWLPAAAFSPIRIDAFVNLQCSRTSLPGIERVNGFSLSGGLSRKPWLIVLDLGRCRCFSSTIETPGCMQYFYHLCHLVFFPVNDSLSDLLLDIKSLQTSPSHYEYAGTSSHHDTFT